VTEELLNIGQVARQCGLSPKALRHYDRIGLLRPAVVDSANGYRWYAPSQVADAQLIQLLRSVDLPLEQVRECLQDNAVLDAVLTKHRRRLQARLTRIQTGMHRIDHIISDGIGITMETTEAQLADEKQLAKDLFNGTWSLLEKDDRSTEDDERMVHMTHASAYHWRQVGTAENFTISEWQVSHVYAVLERPEPAMHHAKLALEICQRNELGDFRLAYAYEGLARAHAVAGDAEEARHWTEQALAVADDVTENPEMLLADLETIPGQPRFW